MNSAINHTCLAVDGRKSCTNPLDNTHYPSALLFNTTTSSTHHCIHIHFIDCVHSSLRTAALGSIASTTLTLLGRCLSKKPWYRRDCSTTPSTSDGLVPEKDLVNCDIDTFGNDTMGGFYMAYLESTLIHCFGNKTFSKPLDCFIRISPWLPRVSKTLQERG
jgi:hypothetical protein